MIWELYQDVWFDIKGFEMKEIKVKSCSCTGDIINIYPVYLAN